MCAGNEAWHVDSTFGRSEDVVNIADVDVFGECVYGSKMSNEIVDGKDEFPQSECGRPVCVDIMCMERRGMVQSSRLG